MKSMRVIGIYLFLTSINIHSLEQIDPKTGKYKLISEMRKITPTPLDLTQLTQVTKDIVSAVIKEYIDQYGTLAISHFFHENIIPFLEYVSQKNAQVLDQVSSDDVDLFNDFINAYLQYTLYNAQNIELTQRFIFAVTPQKVLDARPSIIKDLRDLTTKHFYGNLDIHKKLMLNTTIHSLEKAYDIKINKQKSSKPASTSPASKPSTPLSPAIKPFQQSSITASTASQKTPPISLPPAPVLDPIAQELNTLRDALDNLSIVLVDI
jgi:hypothetical protein